MKYFVMILFLIGFVGLQFADGLISDAYGLEQNKPQIEITPTTIVRYGDTFTIHAWLDSYEKPDDLRYYIDVFDENGRQVDSTLWFARQDFVYEFDTTHPSYNITKGGAYLIKAELANNIERTDIIETTFLFEIVDIFPSPLKQIKSGIKFHNVKCNDGLILAQRGNTERSACVKLDTKIELTVRGWAYDDRVILGCLGERVQKCYPEDKEEYRKALRHYYYGIDLEPTPEPEPTSEDEVNLRGAEQKLTEIYILNSSFGPFNIRDVIVGYGIAGDILVVDVLTEYYESDHLDLIKQKIRDIVGNKVTIEFSPSGAIIPTNIESESEPPGDPNAPKNQNELASKLWYEHTWIIDGTLVDIEDFENEHRYDIQINYFFKPIEESNFDLITAFGNLPFHTEIGDRALFYIVEDNNRLIVTWYSREATDDCPPELKYVWPQLIDPPLNHGEPAIEHDYSEFSCLPDYYRDIWKRLYEN